MVGSTKDKDARKTESRGWACTVAKSEGKPPQGGALDWQLGNGNGKGWRKQSLQVKLLDAEETAAEKATLLDQDQRKLSHALVCLAKAHGQERRFQTAAQTMDLAVFCVERMRAEGELSPLLVPLLLLRSKFLARCADDDALLHAQTDKLCASFICKQLQHFLPAEEAIKGKEAKEIMDAYGDTLSPGPGWIAFRNPVGVEVGPSQTVYFSDLERTFTASKPAEGISSVEVLDDAHPILPFFADIWRQLHPYKLEAVAEENQSVLQARAEKAVEKALEDAWTASSAVVISGATGKNSEYVNGRFELVEREVYSKVGDSCTWLFVGNADTWMVAETDSKDARKTKSVSVDGSKIDGHAVAGAYGKPPQSGAREWKLYDDTKEEWRTQTIQVEHMKEGEGSADAVGRSVQAVDKLIPSDQVCERWRAGCCPTVFDFGRCKYSHEEPGFKSMVLPSGAQMRVSARKRGFALAAVVAAAVRCRENEVARARAAYAESLAAGVEACGAQLMPALGGGSGGDKQFRSIC